MIPRSLHDEAREIFAHALEASSIPAAWDSRLDFDPGSLAGYKEIDVVALGKAALPMLDTLLDRLPRGLAVHGICCAPSLPRQKRRGIRYYAGGHPSPNKDSLRAARAALRLLDCANENSFVFFLISGGGSSLFEAPLDKRIPLEDTIAFHRALVGCGAAIAEINAVRKHFSAVKGGRLAAAAGGAAKFTVLVSDVPAQHLDALASGPTLPDRSTVEECRKIIDRYQLLERFPPRVQKFFANPNLPETPELAHSPMDILLSNDDLLEAARKYAEARGWKVIVDNACDDWDYREAAHYLLKRLHELRQEHSRVCLLSGGEVTVRLEGDPGAGGRNQQFALACAQEIAGQETNLAILSAGSDGVDGLSPAAGAIVDPTTVARAQAQGLDPAAAIRLFDSYPLFHSLGDTVVTGPTNNNLRDLRILLSSSLEPQGGWQMRLMRPGPFRTSTKVLRDLWCPTSRRKRARRDMGHGGL